MKHRTGSCGLIATLAMLAMRAGAQSPVVVEGTVHDSLRGKPLPHAGVVATSLAPARDTVFHSVLADDRGRFAFLDLRPGRYTLTVDHALLDSIGIGVRETEIDVPSIGVTHVALSTPSSHTLRLALCPQFAGDTTLGVILGVIRHVNGTPVVGASVVFSWQDLELDKPSLSVITRPISRSAAADSNGVYRQCGIPLSHPVFVQAQGPQREQSGILQETLGASGVLIRDFRIAVDAVAQQVVISDSAVASTTLSGIVTDVRDRPVASAQVSLAGSGRTLATNDRGEFRFTGAPGGTRSIEVLALGYFPRSVNVEVDRVSAPVHIRMERTAVILDSLRVIAKRSTTARLLLHDEFDSRRMKGFGHYITRADIDSTRPATLFDALRRTPGIKLTQPRGGWDYIVSSSHGVAALGATICPVDVFLDGIKVKQSDLAGLPPELLYGIEVQSVATAPAKYKVGLCGAIFLWSR